MLSKERIKEICLANGFKLEEQPDSSMDLNSYVYASIEQCIAEALKEKQIEETDSTIQAVFSFDSVIKDDYNFKPIR